MNDERLRRLVGDGTSGGGLPLSDAFGKILELLLDNGTASAGELAKAVAAALEYKKTLVFSAFSNWMAFTRDLIAQLLDEGFIISIGMDDVYATTGKVRSGQSLVIIPSADIRVTVYPADTRRVLEKMGEAAAEATRAGLMDDPAARLLDALTEKIGSGQKVKPKMRAGSPLPLEDEPDTIRMCIGCRRDFALTRENFSPFRSRVEWYWPRRCHVCQRDFRAKRNLDAKKEATALKRFLGRHIALTGADGSPDSVRAVMQSMAASGRTFEFHDITDNVLIRKFWDDLAMTGKAPGRRR